MKVPLADLQAQYRSIKPEIDAAIQQVIDSSQFILGKAVSNFEQSFAESHRVKHCVAVGSGTDALHASLWAWGVGRGDAVITTPFTFIATAEAISFTGAKPIFVDIDPKTFTMDPTKLEACVRSHPGAKCKAIIPVHLYGHPAPMKEITAFARKHDLYVLEDACQSHGAMLDGNFVGYFGDAACFSFYPGKNLGAYGEAGAVITNNDNLAKSIRQLRDHGQSEKYKHEFIGHNYRMDGIQGAILGVKLKYLQRWTERRRAIAECYDRLLSGIEELVLPSESPNARHVYHLYVVRTKRRSALQQFLAERDIATALHYPIPLHFQQAYRHLGYQPGDFPVSESAAEECLSLPLFAEMSDAQVDYVATTVRAFFAP